MGWLSNRQLRGATNRSHQRLGQEYGMGPTTAALALALGHACYPNAMYGDKALQDEILRALKAFSTRPCDKQTACRHVEAWLDKGTLSTTAVFRNVWGMAPDRFLSVFFESFEEGT